MLLRLSRRLGAPASSTGSPFRITTANAEASASVDAAATGSWGGSAGISAIVPHAFRTCRTTCCSRNHQTLVWQSEYDGHATETDRKVRADGGLRRRNCHGTYRQNRVGGIPSTRRLA